MRLIGWDCAVEAKKCGIAFGEVNAKGVNVESVMTGLTDKGLTDAISEHISANAPCLLAIDAPLGWPSALGEALWEHKAGGALSHLSNDLFRRSTDSFIKKTTGKQPLDVGAGRIARTALAALQRLLRIREKSQQSLPLAWTPGHLADSACIEVYPASTLKVYGLPAAGYKGKDSKHQAIRDQLVDALAQFMQIPKALGERMRANDDALDAVVCMLAGYDYIRGVVNHPDDQVLAEKEGWIWVRQP
jgi:predicted RNase H-like nuclease